MPVQVSLQNIAELQEQPAKWLEGWSQYIFGNLDTIEKTSVVEFVKIISGYYLKYKNQNSNARFYLKKAHIELLVILKIFENENLYLDYNLYKQKIERLYDTAEYMMAASEYLQPDSHISRQILLDNPPTSSTESSSNTKHIFPDPEKVYERLLSEYPDSGRISVLCAQLVRAKILETDPYGSIKNTDHLVEVNELLKYLKVRDVYDDFIIWTLKKYPGLFK